MEQIMNSFRITKGKNIKIKGAADKKIITLPLPAKVAIQPQDFKGLKVRVKVKVGDTVKVGQVLLEDKTNNAIVVVSPASGTVSAINRGAKRLLLEVVIDTNGIQETLDFTKHTSDQIKSIKRDDLVKALLDGGLWPTLRQRPFSGVANPEADPKNIFVKAMNTDPLAIDIDVALEGLEVEFQAGLDALAQLTSGKVNVSTAPAVKSKALTQVNGADVHSFEGPHPAGNVSTHIYKIAKLEKGDVVWYLDA
ncbi:MAG: Na+-transporting NADH:ubiquinone oxidoreductase subunit A, partial [Lysobacterales bacterium]